MNPTEPPITAVVRGAYGDAFLVAGSIVQHDGARTLLRLPMFFAARWYASDAEGITWVRGLHTEDSEQGTALLAANALACRPIPYFFSTDQKETRHET